MSSRDFRPIRIETLAAATEFPLAGISAIRNATAMSYKLSRTAHTETAIAEQVEFTPSVAPTADEAVLVYADASLVDSGDYSVTDGVVTFDTAPGAGVVVRVDYQSAVAAALPAGSITWFDTHRVNSPAWDAIVPTDEEVCEVM